MKAHGMQLPSFWPDLFVTATLFIGRSYLSVLACVQLRIPVTVTRWTIHRDLDGP